MNLLFISGYFLSEFISMQKNPVLFICVRSADISILVFAYPWRAMESPDIKVDGGKVSDSNLKVDEDE
jgi:hypothetical protein